MTQGDFHSVTVPQLGVNDRLAIVTEWYVEDGDEVGVGQPICALETAKAEIDVEAHVPGYVVTLAAPQSSVETGQDLALIGSSLSRLREEKSGRAPTGFAGTPERTDAVEGAANRDATRSAVASALRLGIRLSAILGNGIIRESDVVDFYLSTRGASEAIPLKLGGDPDLVSVAVYGAGAGAVTVKECLDLGAIYEVVCFIDDDPAHAESLAGSPVYHGDRLQEIVSAGVRHVACGIASGAVRLRVMADVESAGAELVTVIHPAAVISPSASIGEGAYIKAGAIVETNTTVGKMCIVDNGAILPHDNEIGVACHIAPGVSLGSGIKIGSRSIIGIGASIATGVTIGKSVIVTPGSVVTEGLGDLVIADGAPAKVIGTRRSDV